MFWVFQQVACICICICICICFCIFVIGLEHSPEFFTKLPGGVCVPVDRCRARDWTMLSCFQCNEANFQQKVPWCHFCHQKLTNLTFNYTNKIKIHYILLCCSHSLGVIFYVTSRWRPSKLFGPFWSFMLSFGIFVFFGIVWYFLVFYGCCRLFNFTACNFRLLVVITGYYKLLHKG